MTILRSISLATILLCNASAIAETATSTLPIREVTAFKDGHALVLRSGTPTIDADGDVRISELPRAVLGTFWAQCTTPEAPLRSISVERVEKPTQQQAYTLSEVLRANIGREIRFATVTRGSGVETLRSGTILDVRVDPAPAPGARVGAQTPPYLRNPSERSAERPAIAYIREDGVIGAVPLADIVDLRFVTGNGAGEPATSFTDERTSEVMTFDLDWGQAPPPKDAAPSVSVMYLERGVRWIPSYRVTILPGDRVRVELQATLINELADLNDVLLHLAIGVPSFAFQDTLDPTAMLNAIETQQWLDSLGLYFQRSSGNTAAMFSNRIMSQSGRMGESRSPGDFQGGSDEFTDASQQVAGSQVGGSQVEDLFVLELQHVTLAKGARMIVPVSSFETDAKSIYRLDLPAAPHVESLQNVPQESHRAIVELLERPLVRHVLRMTNNSPDGAPLTTAPAIIMKNDRVLAQGLMTYAPRGGSVDLDVGAAVDIAVKTDEVETRREPNAVTIESNSLTRVSVRYDLSLVNRKTQPVTIEVRKFAFGQPKSVSEGGTQAALSVFAADSAWTGKDEARWWHQYNWPFYWHRLNGAARFTWSKELAPASTVALQAEWQYVVR